MTTAYIALGSNLGDRLGLLAQAVDGISHVPETHVEHVSHAYESEPAELLDQPPFLNAVAKVTTGLNSDALLGYLQDLEAELGRERSRDKGPRTIDLDILLFGADEIATHDLTIPHPALLERDFVVTPLLEIAPDIELPDGRKPARRPGLQGRVVRDLGPVPDAGAEHNMPIESTEWVAVAEASGPQVGMGGYDAGLQFKAEVLSQEGIPYAYEPYEPGTDLDLWGMDVNHQLMVPVEYADRAVELLAAVEAAEPEQPFSEGDDLG